MNEPHVVAVEPAVPVTEAPSEASKGLADDRNRLCCEAPYGDPHRESCPSWSAAWRRGVQCISA